MCNLTTQQQYEIAMRFCRVMRRGRRQYPALTAVRGTLPDADIALAMDVMRAIDARTWFAAASAFGHVVHSASAMERAQEARRVIARGLRYLYGVPA